MTSGMLNILFMSQYQVFLKLQELGPKNRDEMLLNLRSMV